MGPWKAPKLHREFYLRTNSHIRNAKLLIFVASHRPILVVVTTTSPKPRTLSITGRRDDDRFREHPNCSLTCLIVLDVACSCSMLLKWCVKREEPRNRRVRVRRIYTAGDTCDARGRERVGRVPGFGLGFCILFRALVRSRKKAAAISAKSEEGGGEARSI